MTKQEVIEALTLIVMSYPASFKDESAVQAMSEVWYRIFRDDNPKLVALAIQKHISVSKWPPSIAEVREQMAELEHPEILPPDVAWCAVIDRIETDGQYLTDLERIFPLLVAKVLRTIGWSELCEIHRGEYGKYLNGQDKKAFMEIYKPAYERAREKAMLPQGLRMDVEKAERILAGNVLKQLDEAHDNRIDYEKQFAKLCKGYNS